MNGLAFVGLLDVVAHFNIFTQQRREGNERTRDSIRSFATLRSN